MLPSRRAGLLTHSSERPLVNNSLPDHDSRVNGRCLLPESNCSQASEGDRPIFTDKRQPRAELRHWELVFFAVKMRQSPARERLPPRWRVKK